MKNVLIIDDCESFREMVVDILSEEGFVVEAAENPETALQLCESTKFDLILCDLVMPVEDEDSNSAMVGVSAIRAISKKYPSIPVVAVSGELTGAPLDAIQNFGAVSCLSKPFGREDLLKAVERSLSTRE